VTTKLDGPSGDGDSKGTRESNKSLLLGSLLLMGLAIGIAYQSTRALHAHTWVDLGARMHRFLVPPFVGFAVAAAVAAVGVFCAREWAKARE
jgi:hypothetical protein